MKSLVVLSGGQDSVTCLFAAVKQHGAANVAALTFDYNQRHAREIQAARDVCKLLDVTNHEVLVLGPILNGTSPLTDPNQQLEQYENAEQMDAIIGDRVEKTFVPMRNALFLTIAANRAVCMGADEVVTGVCQADNANYPDCRLSFIKRQGSAINYALGSDKQPAPRPWLWIRTPLMDLSKADSIRHLVDEGGLAYLAFSHTAYDGQYPPIGKDHATTLRAAGFVEAGYPDPLVLRAADEGLMELPETDNYTDAELNDEVMDQIIVLRQKLASTGG